ncbi:MAG: hypothetical protein C0507_07605 [Cyanobacteria bacterium PR.3.49]|nr:hypothetical protein [Cyanobacteria bacterium PR.3.49]
MTHPIESFQPRAVRTEDNQVSNRLLDVVNADRQIVLPNPNSTKEMSSNRNDQLDFGTSGDLYGDRAWEESDSTSTLENQIVAFGLGPEFASNMSVFEERMGMSEESKASVDATYRSISTLLASTDGALTNEQRIGLAQEMMRHAASPMNVNQGAYNMCVPASMQGKIWSAHPDKAAQIITQAALYSAFTAVDGSVVALDQNSIRSDFQPQIPGLENVSGRDRSEQILQTAIINSFLQYKQLQYSLVEPTVKSTGERITPIGDPATNVYPLGLPTILDESMLANTYARLTGDNSVVGSDFLTTYLDAYNADELGERFSQLKSDGSFPQLASISALDPIVTAVIGEENARGAAEQNISRHVVLIENFDEDTNTVLVRNPLSGDKPIVVSLEAFSNALRSEPLSDTDMVMRTFNDGLKFSNGSLSLKALQENIAALPQYQRHNYLDGVLFGSQLNADQVLTQQQQERLGLAERMGFLERLGAKLGM